VEANTVDRGASAAAKFVAGAPQYRGSVGVWRRSRRRSLHGGHGKPDAKIEIGSSVGSATGPGSAWKRLAMAAFTNAAHFSSFLSVQRKPFATLARCLRGEDGCPDANHEQ